MSSIVGAMCKLFDIHSAASVLTVPRVYPIDAFEYAKYIASKETLDYLFVVFANETTDYSAFENDIVFGDANPLDFENYAASFLIDVHRKTKEKLTISNPFQIKKHSEKHSNKKEGADASENFAPSPPHKLEEFIFDEIAENSYSVKQDYFEGGCSRFEVTKAQNG
jgi:hypothetical protein